MSEFVIEVEGGKSVRLKTAGKYCDRNIVVTATGGGDTEAAYQQGVADGKQAEYDRFWDAYQQNGNRTYYSRLFTAGWTDEILQPKYPVKPQKADNIFYESGIVNALADPQWLDMTECTSAESFARFAAKMKECSLHIPVCKEFNHGVRDCTALTKLTLTGIIENCRFISCFANCNNLTDVTLEGTIGQDISFQWSPLSRESILSCFSVLSDTATGMTATFKQTAVDTAFETSEGLADGSTSAEWLTLVDTKSNWTISLV